jgi:hypothetical protein
MGACSHYLDEPYDNRVELQSVQDYRALLSQAYPERQDLFTDILTDDYHHYANTMQASLTSTYVPLYLWQDHYTEGRATPSAAYAHYYEKIYLANTVIEEVMACVGDEEVKQVLLGEAYVVRAYAYFTLVNLFGMHYNPQTASSDLGVPLVLEVPTANKPTFSRSTVAEVYGQITADIERGLAFFLQHPTLVSSNPYHFNLSSTYAFLCRLHLYRSDWEEAVKYGDLALSESGGEVRDLATDLKQWTSYGVAYFAQEFMNPSTHRNILLASQSDVFLTRPTGFRLSGFYPSHSLYYTFPKDDLRYRLFSAGGTVIDSITNYVKYAQQPNQPNVSVSRYDCFTVEEVLLNRAEALMQQATPDRGQAIESVEKIRRLRISPYAAQKTDKWSDSQLLDWIYAERRKELLGQGMRWFDIKRWRLPVAHRLMRASTRPDAVLTADDRRKALQIPISARIGNPVLENQLNPR